MKINCIIGQAGSGKSTFINDNFPKDEFIFFNVGKILRSMFSCLRNHQDNKNVWEFANPLVYGIFKQCCNVSKSTGYDIVLDGFPRDGTQLSHLNRYLSTPSLGKVSVCIHALDINRSEQAKRISNRDGVLDDYQEKRIDQSRDDFEQILDGLERIFINGKSRIDYKIIWYDQVDGGFVISREASN